MNPKEKAKELFDKYVELSGIFVGDYESEKEMCLITVTYIINSNPHSNPFNTDVYSTMDYWIEVKKEIENL